MPIRLGSSAVSLKLGTQSVTGYLGSQLVTATVPGAPTITLAVEEGAGGVEVFWTAPASNGGSAITGYKIYVDGVETAQTSQLIYLIGAAAAGDVIEVSAVNAIGEGPKSAPFTVVPF